MKKELRFYYFSILFVLIGNAAQAQWQNGLWVGKQANNWYFGMHAGMDFNSIPPAAITDSAISPTFDASDPVEVIIEGTGSISDADGNTLFYTDGRTVWNANNEVMENGEGLLSDISSAQSGLIVPAPGGQGKYYIFTLNRNISGLSYSEVDMSLDGGLGGITENKNVQLASTALERISAVHHADGEQVWVVVNSYEGNQIKSFLVSGDGVNLTPVISNIGALQFGSIGMMKFSPDGSKLAVSKPTFMFTIEVFNFDKATGEVTDMLASINNNDLNNPDLIPTGQWYSGCMGLEFSPDSRYLYTANFAQYDSGSIYQFDLAAGSTQAIKDSGVIIGDPSSMHWTMQLAPDGKIYVTRFNYLAYVQGQPYVGYSTTLDVINFPNNPGLASGFTENAFSLTNGFNDGSMPVFIQSYFASGILHDGDCIGSATNFHTLRIAGITDIAWNFGDPASGSDNVSADLDPSHIFSSPGTYTVTAIITSNGVQQTATSVVTIFPAPDATMPSLSDRSQCADNSGNATFNLTGLDDAILGGQNPVEYTVTYYASSEDLNVDNAIGTPAEFITAGQQIYAVVTNTLTGCKSLMQLDLVVNPLPVPGNPANIQECATNNGEGKFNLISQNAIILGDHEDFEVSYFVNEDDAHQGENPITNTDNFSSSGQTIYAVVINPATGCKAITQFNLIVLDAPILEELEFKGCSPFDLGIITAEVGTGFTLKYYTTEEDALNRTNAISNSDHYVFTGNEVTIYILAENQEGCTAIALLQLYKDSCEIQKGISPNGDGKNDFFDLSGFDVQELNVFNRYGIEVYSKSNYTNEWSGQTNKGDELPTGTYYYMMKSNDGKNQTGWVYINRQE